MTNTIGDMVSFGVGSVITLGFAGAAIKAANRLTPPLKRKRKKKK